MPGIFFEMIAHHSVGEQRHPTEFRHAPEDPPQRFLLMNASAFTLRVIYLAPLGSVSSKKMSPPRVRDITW